MPLYQDIAPLARGAHIHLTGLDRLLCERIESLRQEITDTSSEVGIPGLQPNVSFECEFFAFPKTLPDESQYFSYCPVAENIIKDDNKELYVKAGCKLIPDRERRQKVEAISIPHADGTFDSQPECIRHYFQFRDTAAKDLSSRFKDHRFRRF